MRRFVLLFLASSLAVLKAVAVPALLETAVEKVSDEVDRWAYTQTLVERNDKGKIIGEATVRFDPSKPFAEQYTPLLVDGQPPTSAHLKKYRKQGERRGQRLERAENEGTTPVRKTLGELMNFEQAVPVGSDARTTTFEIPLKKEGNQRLPPEKFRVTARVNNELRAFEQIDVQLRSAMRARVLVKLKTGEGRLEFSTIDPKYAPAVTGISGDASGSIAMVPIGRRYEVKRTDFQRVRPFQDRFQVKMGPMKSIDF